jgi:hypothetical protein
LVLALVHFRLCIYNWGKEKLPGRNKRGLEKAACPKPWVSYLCWSPERDFLLSQLPSYFYSLRQIAAAERERERERERIRSLQIRWESSMRDFWEVVERHITSLGMMV